MHGQDKESIQNDSSLLWSVIQCHSYIIHCLLGCRFIQPGLPVAIHNQGTAGLQHPIYFRVKSVEVHPVHGLSHRDQVCAAAVQKGQVLSWAYSEGQILELRWCLGDLRLTHIQPDDFTESLSQRQRALSRTTANINSQRETVRLRFLAKTYDRVINVRSVSWPEFEVRISNTGWLKQRCFITHCPYSKFQPHDSFELDTPAQATEQHFSQ